MASESPIQNALVIDGRCSGCDTVMLDGTWHVYADCVTALRARLAAANAARRESEAAAGALREVLEFYADRGNYFDGQIPGRWVTEPGTPDNAGHTRDYFEDDGGDTARAALASSTGRRTAERMAAAVNALRTLRDMPVGEAPPTPQTMPYCPPCPRCEERWGIAGETLAQIEERDTDA